MSISVKREDILCSSSQRGHVVTCGKRSEKAVDGMLTRVTRGLGFGLGQQARGKEKSHGCSSKVKYFWGWNARGTASTHSGSFLWKLPLLRVFRSSILRMLPALVVLRRSILPVFRPSVLLHTGSTKCSQILPVESEYEMYREQNTESTGSSNCEYWQYFGTT